MTDQRPNEKSLDALLQRILESQEADAPLEEDQEAHLINWMIDRLDLDAHKVTVEGVAEATFFRHREDPGMEREGRLAVDLRLMFELTTEDRQELGDLLGILA